MILATASQWAALQASSSTSSVACGTPPNANVLPAVSIFSKKELPSSEVLLVPLRQFRTLGRLVFRQRLHVDRNPGVGGTHQPDHSWSGDGRAASLPLRCAGGPKKRSLWRHDPRVDSDRGETDDEIPEHVGPRGAEGDD